MSKRLKSKAAPSEHDRNCLLHRPLHSQTCPARRKNGLICGKTINLQIYNPLLGRLPTCSSHHADYLRAGHCTAIQECGFSCGQLIEWHPHEHQLCAYHTSDAPCYFMKLPAELRLQIYSCLFPDAPTHPYFRSPFRSARSSVFIAILQTCRQIHSEAIGVLYRVPIGIYVTSDSVTICNITRLRLSAPTDTFEMHYDQQMRRESLQTMLNRLHTEMSSPSLLWWEHFPIKQSTWCRMQSFVIEVALPDDNYLPTREQGRSITSHVALSCDMIRRVTERLKQIKRIQKLEISIQLGRWAESTASKVAEDLLSRFHSVIQHVSRLKISITVNNTTISSFDCSGSKEHIVPKGHSLQGIFHSFANEMNNRETQPQLPSTGSQLAISSAKLAKIEILISTLQHPLISAFLGPDEVQDLKALYNNAIEARETDNISAFQRACEGLQWIFTSYVARQKEAQASIQRAFEIIDASP